MKGTLTSICICERLLNWVKVTLKKEFEITLNLTKSLAEGSLKIFVLFYIESLECVCVYVISLLICLPTL